MSFDLGFYLIDHRLVALMMVVLLLAAAELGFRLGSSGTVYLIVRTVNQVNCPRKAALRAKLAIPQPTIAT